MMGEMLRFIQSNRKLELRISAPKTCLLAKISSKKTPKCVTSMKVSLVATGDIGVFLLANAVLEIVRRFSTAHSPFIWHGLQAAQILCCRPPFKQWAPITGLVKAMQTFLKPLMFLTMATGLLGGSGTSKGTLSGSGADLTELSSQLATQDARNANEVSRSVDMENHWLVKFYQELEKQGITLPERLDEDELCRFYHAKDGDFAKFLSSVKKSIRWRQEYTLLSQQELLAWDNLVFWHGYDVMHRPSLIIRVGLATSNLDSDAQAQFVRAVVSQVEYGVINLVDAENRRLTVLLDCDRLSPFKFPIQTYRSSVALLQDHYPNRLGCLLVVRVPSIAGVMTQTLSEDLKPRTWEKLRIIVNQHNIYRDDLRKYFENLPPFPPSIADMSHERIDNCLNYFTLLIISGFLCIIFGLYILSLAS